MIQLVAQRRSFDCGVAVISMWAHMRYEDVFVAAVQTAPRWKRSGGLSTRQLIAIAQRVGRHLVPVNYRKVDLEEHTGILGINWNKPKNHGADGHWVVLFEGVIVDPSGPEVWDAASYLQVNNGRAATLLVEK